jgi:hypothetical protein
MIVAQIATIPGREKTLQIAIDSLFMQVDKVRIYPNSISDGLKFSNLKEFKDNDIIFICDDDICYPADFVETMMQYLRYGVVVTIMGKIMKSRPIQSYCRDELFCAKTFEENKELVQVEVPGTCGMAFYKSTCRDLDHTWFKSMNSDIWMAKYCKENKIPCYVIPHPADWVKNLMPLLPPDSPNVWDQFKDNDKPLTDLINSFL